MIPNVSNKYRPTQLFIISGTRPSFYWYSKSGQKSLWKRNMSDDDILSPCLIYPFLLLQIQISFSSFFPRFFSVSKEEVLAEEAWKKQLREGFWKGLFKQKGGIACLMTRVVVVEGATAAATQVEGTSTSKLHIWINYMHLKAAPVPVQNMAIILLSSVI